MRVCHERVGGRDDNLVARPVARCLLAYQGLQRISLGATR